MADTISLTALTECTCYKLVYKGKVKGYRFVEKYHDSLFTDIPVSMISSNGCCSYKIAGALTMNEYVENGKMVLRTADEKYGIDNGIIVPYGRKFLFNMSDNNEIFLYKWDRPNFLSRVEVIKYRLLCWDIAREFFHNSLNLELQNTGFPLSVSERYATLETYIFFKGSLSNEYTNKIAEVLKRWLLWNGIPFTKILCERRGETTYGSVDTMFGIKIFMEEISKETIVKKIRGKTNEF